MNTPRIRVATDADWPRIWPFFDATVQAGETYAFPTDLTIETGRGWWMERPPGETVVLEEELCGEGSRILGSAKMGPNRPAHGDHIGTASFMVAPEARGRGVGRALGEHVVQWHRDHGFRGIQFNAVVETNTAAVRLWRSLGFEIVGTVPGAFRSPTQGYVGLHVMFLPLV
jgi:GNAT superfamily N-acetyltransferase